MRITREEVDGFAHCRQHLDDDGRPTPDGATTGRLCPGYQQQEVRVIREVVQHLFWDYSPDAEVDSERVSHETEQLHFADEADRECPSCGALRHLSLQRRRIYPRLHPQRPDEILRIQRDRDQVAVSTADAMQSLATTLSDRGSQDARIAALEAELGKLKARKGA